MHHFNQKKSYNSFISVLIYSTNWLSCFSGTSPRASPSTSSSPWPSSSSSSFLRKYVFESRGISLGISILGEGIWWIEDILGGFLGGLILSTCMYGVLVCDKSDLYLYGVCIQIVGIYCLVWHKGGIWNWKAVWPAVCRSRYQFSVAPD